jgi:hypothetical protein
VNIDNKHLFNNCKPPDELNEMTKDLTKDTRKTLFRYISKGRGTLLAIGILPADKDIKKV